MMMGTMKPIGKLCLAVTLGLVVGCGEEGHHDEGGHDDGPEIVSVTWSHAPGCVAGTPADVTIEIDAVDPNTPISELSYVGMAPDCTGTIDAASATINCPQADPVSVSVTVADEEVHTDTLDFVINACEDGEAAHEEEGGE